MWSWGPAHPLALIRASPRLASGGLAASWLHPATGKIPLLILMILELRASQQNKRQRSQFGFLWLLERCKICQIPSVLQILYFISACPTSQPACRILPANLQTQCFVLMSSFERARSPVDEISKHQLGQRNFLQYLCLNQLINPGHGAGHSSPMLAWFPILGHNTLAGRHSGV